jgi:hypothetical protein
LIGLLYTRTVFPGGVLPTVTLLVSSLDRATSGQLIIDSISNIGPHYARTLREWRRNVVDNFAEIEQALRKDHPGMFDSEQDERSAHELAVFRRKWLCKKNPIYLWLFDSRGWLINFLSPLNRLLVRLSFSFGKIQIWTDVTAFCPTLVAIARSGSRRGC